jgi:hypothetical protein
MDNTDLAQDPVATSTIEQTKKRCAKNTALEIEIKLEKTAALPHQISYRPPDQ